MVQTLNEMVAEAKRDIDVLPVVRARCLVPRGVLEIKADTEYPKRDLTLQDRQQQVITYCTGGSVARITNVGCGGRPRRLVGRRQASAAR